MFVNILVFFLEQTLKVNSLATESKSGLVLLHYVETSKHS